MQSPVTRRSLALAAALVLAVNTLVASAAIGDAAADRILGQPNGTSNTPPGPVIGASDLLVPWGAAFDAAGNLWVSDFGNHRVLGYRSPMTTDSVADVVIGQPDLNSSAPNNGGVSARSLNFPMAVAVSAAGDVYVADAYNNRVLGYDRPLATDTIADRVIGQPDFASRASNNGGLGAASIYYPTGVAVDVAGDLWVVDTGNNRVLRYEDPVATDAVAEQALGQRTLDMNEPNSGGLGAASLHAPFAVAVDPKGNVWVADGMNNRVLEYDDPKRFDGVADFVLGQPDLTSNTRNYPGEVGAAGLGEVHGICVDPNGNVYVADTYNNRVLMYRSPLVTGDRLASRVFGQPDFASNAENNGGVSAGSLYYPSGVAVDSFGNVAVTDFWNNRAVVLAAPTPVVTSIAVKVSPATGRAKLVVAGFGMVSGSAVVEVDGVPLATTKYKEPAADDSARRLIALDPSFDALVPRGVEVRVTVFNPLTGGRSAPVPFTR